MMLLTALLAIGAVACSDNEDADAKPTATADQGEAPLATATALPAGDGTSDEPTVPPQFEGTRGPIGEERAGQPIVHLVDVRTGRHDGFDRVVFEFDNALPGYQMEYVEPPITEDASDLPVDIQGNAFLQIVFYPARGVDLSGDTPRQTCCRSEITTGFAVLIDLQDTGDFEAVLTYVMGLSEEVDFRVLMLQDPFRIVVDAAHP